MELDGIHNQKWNADRVIVFQTFILQRDRLIYISRNICDQILSRLEQWNKGAYEKLVQDSYGAVAAYLGKTRDPKPGATSL